MGRMDTTDSDSYVVLIAGEHWKVSTGERWLGQHCSLPFIGKAYEQCASRIGRERVIVIAQLNETLQWLEEAAETGMPMWCNGISVEESASRWTGKLQETQDACAVLIADGGADYDGAACHPRTVIDVLMGNPRAGGRVVPKRGTGAVMIGL